MFLQIQCDNGLENLVIVLFYRVGSLMIFYQLVYQFLPRLPTYLVLAFTWYHADYADFVITKHTTRQS